MVNHGFARSLFFNPELVEGRRVTAAACGELAWPELVEVVELVPLGSEGTTASLTPLITANLTLIF
jgi:hypothetical protein